MLCFEQMSEVLSALPDPAFILTRTGRYAAVFGGADSRYYQHVRELSGQPVKDILNSEKADWFISQINQALDTGRQVITKFSLSMHDLKGRDDSGHDNVIYFEGRVQPLSWQIDGEDAVIWLTSNITKRHRLEKRLRCRSETDALTGMWNRRYFYQMVGQERRKARRYKEAISLLILDIDYFKLINDQLGHTTGDSVLCELASLMVNCLRESDTVVRWGGEEFVVFMPNTRLDAASKVAEKLRRSVEQYQFSEAPKITVSIGYAEWNFEEDMIDELIAKADAALYRAKNRGRNQIQGDC